MELTPNEALALGIALEKQLKPLVNDAKGNAKLRLFAVNEEYGADSMEIKVGNTKVGKVSLRGGGSEVSIWPGNEADALAFLREHGLTVETPVKGWQDAFTCVQGKPIFTETGEDGEEHGFCMSEKAVTAAITGCAPKDVMPAFVAKFGTVPMAGLLGDGYAD